MIGGKGNSSIRPVALGMALTQSTYGATIPVILGRARSTLLLIWAANLRSEGGKKKGGGGKLKGGKKGGQQNYRENVDFLLGHNPIAGPLQFWENQSTRYPLNFTKTTGSGTIITVADPNFYSVIGVTMNYSASETFSDFGDPLAPRTVVGAGEMPLWNAAYNGPNPTNSGAYRNGLFYYWLPGSGPTLYFDQAAAFGPTSGTVNIYYAQTDVRLSPAYDKKASGTAVPAAALHLTFESTLGDGPEYTGTDHTSGIDLSTQQLLYPHYAGLGSAKFDLGGTAMPDVRCEVLGAYPLYATGDCDFADMVEDIFHQGLSQPAFLPATLDGTVPIQAATNPVQRGLNCYSFPGPIQKKATGSVEAGSGAQLTYDFPITPGNFLVVSSSVGGVGFNPGSISDSAGHSWTAVLPGGGMAQLWWAQVTASVERCTVTLSGAGVNYDFEIMEIAGVDTFDSSAVGTFDSVKHKTTAAITTTTTPGYPGYVMAFSFYSGILGNNVDPHLPLWSTIVASNHGVDGPTHTVVQDRQIYYPATIPFVAAERFGSDPPPVALLAFKSSQPATFARPLGDILDYPSLDLTRRQCRANGLWGSLVMDSQQKASDWLDPLMEAMVAAPVWSGFRLKIIPRSEVSTCGNGVVYNAPTSSGPVVRLRRGDFLGPNGEFITVDRQAQVDTPSIPQYQHPSRQSDYNDVTVSQPETGTIARYGPRKDSPKRMEMIYDPSIARSLLGVKVRRQNYIRDLYHFSLNASQKLLEPMDLVPLPDPDTGLTIDALGNDITVPVRITSVEEDENYELTFEAEPYVYGTHNPIPLTVSNPEPYQPMTGAGAGNVNAPVILEPVPRLSNQTNQGQLWIGVSSPAKNYGGSIVYISTDGGNSYKFLDSIQGNAVTGVTLADWPAAADPDVTNNLAVDLTESIGELDSHQVVDEDNFVYVCYVEGGNANIPYELMTYGIARLDAPDQYTLLAT